MHSEPGKGGGRQINSLFGFPVLPNESTELTMKLKEEPR